MSSFEQKKTEAIKPYAELDKDLWLQMDGIAVNGPGLL
jgi:hypothetical protein